METSIGFGTTEEFFMSEFQTLNLKDQRLKKRAFTIFEALQSRLTSCIRRLFIDQNDARQAYDFF